MSADNGTTIRKTTGGLYEVTAWQGESAGVILGKFETLDEAVEVVVESGSTEYGTYFVGWER